MVDDEGVQGHHDSGDARKIMFASFRTGDSVLTGLSSIKPESSVTGDGTKLPLYHAAPPTCVLMPMDKAAGGEAKKASDCWRLADQKRGVKTWIVKTEPPALDVWDGLCRYVLKWIAPSLPMCPEWRRIVEFVKKHHQGKSASIEGKHLGHETWLEFTNLLFKASESDLCKSEKGNAHWEYIKPYMLADAGPWFNSLACKGEVIDNSPPDLVTSAATGTPHLASKSETKGMIELDTAPQEVTGLSHIASEDDANEADQLADSTKVGTSTSQATNRAGDKGDTQPDAGPADFVRKSPFEEACSKKFLGQVINLVPGLVHSMIHPCSILKCCHLE